MMGGMDVVSSLGVGLACCMLHTAPYKLNSTDGKEKMIGDIIGDEG